MPLGALAPKPLLSAAVAVGCSVSRPTSCRACTSQQLQLPCKPAACSSWACHKPTSLRPPIFQGQPFPRGVNTPLFHCVSAYLLNISPALQLLPCLAQQGVTQASKRRRNTFQPNCINWLYQYLGCCSNPHKEKEERLLYAQTKECTLLPVWYDVSRHEVILKNHQTYHGYREGYY